MREIGVLLIAFAPLDAISWNDAPFRWRVVLAFLVIGVVLLSGALALEVSRDPD